MKNWIRLTLLAAGAGLLLLTAGAEPAQAAFITQIRGEYGALTSSLPPTITPAPSPGVQVFYMTKGKITSVDPADPLLPIGSLINDLGVDLLSFTTLSDDVSLSPLSLTISDGLSSATFGITSTPVLFSDLASHKGIITADVKLISNTFAANLDLFKAPVGGILEITITDTLFNRGSVGEGGRAIFPASPDASASFKITALPEPASVALCLIGAGALGLCHLRRRRSSGQTACRSAFPG